MKRRRGKEEKRKGREEDGEEGSRRGGVEGKGREEEQTLRSSLRMIFFVRGEKRVGKGEKI